MYEVYAARYAHHQRTAAENFIGGDSHDGPMPMDYFVWLIRDAMRAFVVDTGFDADAARRRGHDPDVMRRYPAPARELERGAPRRCTHRSVTRESQLAHVNLFPAVAL